MTVKELIECLQAMPEDAAVLLATGQGPDDIYDILSIYGDFDGVWIDIQSTEGER